MTDDQTRGARRSGWPARATVGTALALAAGLALAAPGAAHAQISPNGPEAPLLKGAKLKGGAKPPPSALPGARANHALAPAAVNAAAMDPNAALFDAINRDDLAAARDALNRGAELGAENALGMTPLQLSIDLGRNDITFVLLAMRGADRGPSGPPAAGPVGYPPSGSPVRGRVAAAPPRVAPMPRRTAAAPPRAAAVRVAGEGGTPVPSAGFLGFDPGH